MSKQTCLACRGRKMRCDGVTPVCGPCTRARKPVECVYSATTARERKAALLQKGAACLPCRRKKKKCDAKRPYCATCKIAGREAECEYDEESRQNLTAALLMRTQQLEQRLAEYESRDLENTSGGPLPTAAASHGRVTLGPWQGTPGSNPLSILGDFTAGSSLNVVGSSTSNSLIAAASLWAPELHVSEFLSFDDPFTLGSMPNEIPIMPVNAHQLRSIFLLHRIQIGYYLRQSKRQAIEEGDYSGQTVHRTVVHLAHLIGNALYRTHYQTASLAVDPQLELQYAFSALQDPPDAPTMVVIHCLFAWYFLFERDMDNGFHHMRKAWDVIAERELTFNVSTLDTVLSFAEPDEDTKEHVSALCQLLYLEKAAQIVIGVDGFVSSGISQALKDVIYVQPWMAKHSVLVARCRSAALLLDTIKLSRERDAEITRSGIGNAGVPAMPPEWYTRYWDLLEEVAQHSAMIYPQMLRTSMSSDTIGLCFKVSIIVSLTAQLELLRMSAGFHSESKQKATDTTLEILGITYGLKDEDFAQLEPILGVCFMMLATVLRKHADWFAEGLDRRQQQAFVLLIQSTTKLTASVPYAEDSLQAICEITSTT